MTIRCIIRIKKINVIVFFFMKTTNVILVFLIFNFIFHCFFIATGTQSFFSNKKHLIKFESKFRRSKKIRKKFEKFVSFDNDKFRRSTTDFDNRKKQIVNDIKKRFNFNKIIKLLKK